MKLLWETSAFLGILCGLTSNVQAHSINSRVVSAVAPPCALECMGELIPRSTCSMTNVTCICTNELLNEAINVCVEQNCTIKEALTTAKYSEVTCGRPERDRSDEVSVTAIVGCALATVSVILRIISRWTGAGGQWGIDDFIIVPAMFLLMLPYSVGAVLLAQYGIGKDIWDLPFENITKTLEIYYALELGYLLIGALTKLALLFLYLRLFSSKEFRRMVYVVMTIVVLYCVIWEVISIFQCTPINGAWLKWDGINSDWVGTCRDINAQAWGAAAVNLTLDAAILIMPLSELYKLALSPRKKIQIGIMFCTGFFVTAVSLVRLKSLVQFAASTNLTWDYTAMAYWSHIELQVGIICACMPAIRSLLRKMFPGKQNPLGSVSSGTTFQKTNSKSTGGDFVRLNDLEYGTARYTPEPPEGESGQARTLQIDKVNYTIAVEPKNGWPLASNATPR